ncbi:MAG: SRPBCC domain-containing protein [Bacteroidia bacterium]|nr:SRPBCC domain-containing protein [Bacteroidota bacterium]MBP9082755.1 SRPBCC domain-containing protein [Bacteroidia bacterium]
MKDFDWTQFTKRIAIKAPLEDLYKAWTSSNELEKWFLKKARFFDENNQEISLSEPVSPKNTYLWNWFLYEETEKGEITIANGKDHLQFTFAGSCLVDVTFSREHEHTIVELKQTGIPLDDKSKQFIRLGCSSGWSFYLVNLKSVYEGGLDLRSKDERLRPMVNN